MDDVNRSQSSSQPPPANTPSTPQAVQAAGDPAPPPALTPEELAAARLLGKIDEFKAMAPDFHHHNKKRRLFADPTPCPTDRRRYRRDVRMQLRGVKRVLNRESLSGGRGSERSNH